MIDRAYDESEHILDITWRIGNSVLISATHMREGDIKTSVAHLAQLFLTFATQ